MLDSDIFHSILLAALECPDPCMRLLSPFSKHHATSSSVPGCALAAFHKALAGTFTSWPPTSSATSDASLAPFVQVASFSQAAFRAFGLTIAAVGPNMACNPSDMYPIRRSPRASAWSLLAKYSSGNL